MMTSKDLTESRKKIGDETPAPPGFVSLTSFTLKRTKRDREPEQNEAYSKTTDIENLQKSVKHRPWILGDQLTNLEKPNTQHLNMNISVENTLPKGVIRGCPSCSNCQKVIACWRPEEGCRPSVKSTSVLHPTEEEFKDIYKYIEKIRPKAEENGICRILPPESWKPPFLLKGNKFDTTRFGTHVQEINALKDLHSKRKLNEIIELKDGSDGFEFESGPEFTLPAFKRYAEQFKQNYFKKQDMFTGVGTPAWENVEGEYWRIIQNPTEEIQVLSGHNLETKVLGSGFPLPSLDDHNDDQSKYRKSGWNLNNTPNMPGSLLPFDCDNSTPSTSLMDVGMCFSSLCWKVEEHHLYLLSYMHLGSSRIWYGVPSKYRLKCEALLKKTFPELSRHRELFHKLVTQLSPSILKSEGIPVYRCVQHPKQFILIFPGAYYWGFDTGFSVSEKANFAPLDWLPHGQLTVETYSEMHRKTSISYDKILLGGAREAAKSSWDSRKRGWNNACGKDGWFTRALKSRVRRESFKREFLCNGARSRKMEEDFGCSLKRECFLCFSDLYLSAAGCSCSPDKYSCLEHSKQICTCPWSSRFFLYRSSIDELNLLIDTLSGKVNPKSTTFTT
ncbi:transcription factor jumonji (jmj) family protein / zinc finger (C5HC2 type) family protein [Artemisia annua]|uniref:Transcription factor jumonji (Jmj) family protein / zinc finger (C5HC2 type) family protein n=1 Tax=Artemisia annua TaxID=35608 RepID=A0A2U1P8F6_ARTAN|nr:transcription factor jumonji (jmj) family protein / zinc finger (C5HC2 type) family protein [Artemisia annua]